MTDEGGVKLVRKDGRVYLMVPWEVSVCARCGALMRPRHLAVDDRGAYQTQRAIGEMGLVARSPVNSDDDKGPICVTCAERGGVTFLCALCGHARSSDLFEEEIGDPPERLCSPCYEAVPAKTWDDAVARLHREHRYDHE